MTAWRTLATWPARRWLVASGWTLSTVLVVGISTVLIPNPIFGREIAATWWSWPALIATALLAGLVGATYVRTQAAAPTSRVGMAGGLLTFFAVGCPVCNKVALIALGYSGALQWFAPVQPVLAIAGIALLGYALHRRLQGEIACAI